MRKKHQSLHISTIAKKNFCKEISLNDYTYEEEIRDQLKEYFDNNIKDEDVENNDENNNSSDDEDIFDFKSINIQKGDINLDNLEEIKFQISEKAILNRIDENNYDFISKKNDKDNNDINLGDKINFNDIIKQFIFWKENKDNNDKKNCEIDAFELINLNSEKIKMIKQKINEIKNIVKEKKMDKSLLDQLIKDLENNYTEQTKELNNLVKNIENIDSISYGKNYSIVEYKNK